MMSQIWYQILRYNFLKFEFPTILLLKIAKTQILKRYIFRLDRHISNGFEILVKDLSKSNIRYLIMAKLKFGTKFMTSFSRQKCQNLKNKKHRILENDKFFLVPSFRIIE